MATPDINKIQETFDVNNDGKLTFGDVLESFGSAFNVFTRGGNFGGGNISVPGTKTQVKDPEQGSKVNPQEIIGLPPFAYLEDSGDESMQKTVQRILQTMLVITLEPCIPSYNGVDGDVGLDLYKLTPIPTSGKGSLSSLLQGTGIQPLTMPLKLAVQNESNFTESWSNQFGESKAESVVNVGSAMGQEIRFISGKDTISEGMESIMSDLGEIGGLLFGDMAKSAMDMGTNAIAGAAKKLESGISEHSNLGRGLTRAAAGSKIDFPQIWQGCEFSPSYQFTLKLYNPYPTSEEAYRKYILSPLAHLLLFVCPASDSNFTFGFPLLCKMKCPGIAGLSAAYIQQLDVIKGGSGESSDISYTQRPGSIDVRFTVTSLYNSMVTRGEEDVSEERPTLDSYIRDLRGSTEIPNVYEKTNPNPTSVMNYDDTLRNGSLVRETLNRGNIVDGITDLIDVGLNTVRTSLDALDAFSDPLINNIMTANELLNDENIILIGNYKEEYASLENIRTELEQSLQLPDKIALKIKHGLPIPRELSNWFWNNVDTFDTVTSGIIRDILPPSIEPKTPARNIDEGLFANAYDLSSRVPAQRTASF